LLFAILRRLKPIVVLGTRIPGWVVLTRYDDVVAMLARDDVFSACLYQQRMEQTLGAFILGMDETPQYRREWGAVRDAIRPGDLDRVRALAADTARAIVERAIPAGRLDVGADLAEPVHLRYAADYYGFPGPGDSATDVLRGFRTTAFYIFNFWIGGAFEMAAIQAGADLQRAIARQVAERKAHGPGGPDDFIGRLLAQQRNASDGTLDDDAVRRLVGGTVSGSLEPGIGMFVRAMDRLVDLPAHELGVLRGAARDGNDAAVLRFVLEAARFNPFPPYAYRYCTKDFVMAPGTRRERIIPQGATVVPLFQSAMFDGGVVRRPTVFQPGRPDAAYLNFGHGQHECLGRRLGEVMLTEMAKPLLALRGLRRASGARGRMQSGPAGVIPEGYYTRHLVLEFDA
jgi:cytochrome P450